MFTVEKGIPIPGVHRECQGANKSFLESLQIGDSFTIDKKTYNTIRQMARTYGYRLLGRKIEGEMFRVWMVEKGIEPKSYQSKKKSVAAPEASELELQSVMFILKLIYPQFKMSVSSGVCHTDRSSISIYVKLNDSFSEFSKVVAVLENLMGKTIKITSYC